MDLAGDLAIFFDTADGFAVVAAYQAYVNGAPSGAPFTVPMIEDSEGKFVQIGRLADADYNRRFLARLADLPAAAKGDQFTISGATYTVAAKPRATDSARDIIEIPAR